MTTQPVQDDNLPPVAPDIVEQDQPDEMDNIVPTRGDQMLPMVGLGSQFAEKHHLEVEINADRDASPADEQTRDLLFQVARELLLNVVKHAETPLAWLQVLRIDGQIVLKVRDEGVGFDPSQPPPDGHSFGLFHIRERVEAVGGALAVEIEPGKGTRIVAQLPRRL